MHILYPLKYAENVFQKKKKKKKTKVQFETLFQRSILIWFPVQRCNIGCTKESNVCTLKAKEVILVTYLNDPYQFIYLCKSEGCFLCVIVYSEKLVAMFYAEIMFEIYH